MIKWAGRLMVLYRAAHTPGAPTVEGAARRAGSWFSGELGGGRPRRYEPCQQRVMAECGQLRRAAHRGRPVGAVAGPPRHHTSAVHRMDAGDLDRGRRRDPLAHALADAPTRERPAVGRGP